VVAGADEVGLAEEGTAEEAGRVEVEEEEIGRTTLEEVGRAEEELAIDDRVDELATMDEAGRADEVDVAGRAEVEGTMEDDTRVEEATEDDFEAEETLVTGFVPDEPGKFGCTANLKRSLSTPPWGVIDSS